MSGLGFELVDRSLKYVDLFGGNFYATINDVVRSINQNKIIMCPSQFATNDLSFQAFKFLEWHDSKMKGESDVKWKINPRVVPKSCAVPNELKLCTAVEYFKMKSVYYRKQSSGLFNQDRCT